MAKINLSWVNHVDGSGTVFTASDAAGDLSIENIASPIIGRRWRTTSLTAWGQADFGSNKTVQAVCLRFPRDTDFPTAGTVRHQFDADGGTAGSGAAYDSTAVAIGTADGYGYHVHKASASFSARYWRFTLNVSGVDFVDVGRAWCGEVFAPAFDIEFGNFADEWRDASQVSVTQRSGAEYVDERYFQRVISFGLGAIGTTDFDTVREMSRLAGTRRQILLLRDPASPARETVIGRLAGTTALQHRDINLFRKTFEVRESP